MLLGTTVIVVAGLAVWVCAAYDTTLVADLPSSPPVVNRGIYSSPTSLLSLPLPGTRRREEVEATQGLRSALEAFDGIAAAQVVLAAPFSASTDSLDSPQLSLQLRLSPSATPTDEWVGNVVTFILHTVPGLKPTNLLIADSSGRLLFAQGKALSSIAPLATTASSLSATTQKVSLPWPQAIIFTAGCLVVILSIYGLLRRRSVAREHSEEPGPTLTSPSPAPAEPLLQFLQQLSPQQIINLLEDERPEVANLTTHYLANGDIAEQIRHRLGLPPAGLGESDRTVRDDILTSMARALRAKLSALDQTVDAQFAAVSTQPASGGDYDG